MSRAIRSSSVAGLAGSFGILTLILAVAHAQVAEPGMSPDGVWETLDPDDVTIVDPRSLPSSFALAALDAAALEAVLAGAPMEGGSTLPAFLYLPLPDASFALVQVVASPLAGDLAVLLDGARVAPPPLPRTFAFEGASDPALAGRLSVGADGRVRALMQTSDGIVRIDPFESASGETFYGSFLNRDRTDGADRFEHVVGEQIDPNTPVPGVAGGMDLLAAATAAERTSLDLVIRGLEQTGTELRTYRLAVAATGEYFAGRSNAMDPLPTRLQDVVDSIAAEINSVNALLEPEVAVRLSFDWVLVWTDPNTDPYDETANPMAPACALRDQNVAIDPIIGAANYDVGFVFNAGPGNGCAWYVLCLADKYRGAARINLGNPIGGSTGVLLHEMGHQLGARHTFSGSGCAMIEFNPQAGYAPGSGTTIMSYLGSCGTDDVDTSGPAPSAGQYYHGISFDEIASNTQSLACGTVTPTANDPPMVEAGPNFTIPRGTPFMLSGMAMDPNGHPLTYNWEQFDQAATQRPIDSALLMDGPIFRSVPPTSSPTRTLPLFADILSGTQRAGEILPGVDRTMTFRLTARDNRPAGGGVASDEMTIDVQGSPFFLTSPDGGETEFEGCPVPVDWVVGGGSVAAQVDISYSSDGGASFGLLEGAVSNDGSDSVMLPCGTTAEGRMLVKAFDNIFFDVSDGDFAVIAGEPSVAVSAQGGEVDDDCQFTVEFAATAEDDCGLSANDVTVNVVDLSGNFTLGTPVVAIMQVDPVTVDVDGSVLVSDLTSSPATVGIEVIAEDACGNQDSDHVEVDVVDATPPTLSVELSPDTLWPPNHKLRNVTATVVAEDNCPGVTFVLTSVTSDEPDNGKADGNTVNDIQGADIGTPDTELLLRAERQGTGDGRLYTVTYTATDGSNNQVMASDGVAVDHNQ